jgi:hypothetical protein
MQPGSPDEQFVAKITIVERIARPVRTTIKQKRKIREELLAHLEGALAEELKKTSDRAAALEAASKRLGDPRTVSAELDQSISPLDRISYYIDRLLGWRAPESALRYMLRVALTVCTIEAIVFLPFVVLTWFAIGAKTFRIADFRFILAFMASLPLGQFCVGVLYYKMRDTWWGVFGSRRSTPRLILLSAAMAMVVGGGGFAFVALATWKFATPAQMVVPAIVVGVLVSIAHLLLARFRGLTEIADTIWACLAIDGSKPEVAS